jgi:hypothetical protein
VGKVLFRKTTHILGSLADQASALAASRSHAASCSAASLAGFSGEIR